MVTLQEIKRPIEKELRDFEPYFRKSLRSDVPLLGTILDYVYRSRGKQLRPVFVFLSARLFGETTEDSYLAACSVELLHTASLIHDDVVDDSFERRGLLSVKALWQNKLAVLVGDYILSKGLILQLENKRYGFLHLISRAVKDMSEGEILQIKKSRNLDMDADTYFEIIRKKTASLIATSMAIGASSITNEEEVIEKMYRIGQDAGIAFQIKDDIFDYLAKGLIGKPTGNDIKEKKITLPLLHLLSRSSLPEKLRILWLVKSKNKKTETINKLVKQVVDSGGIEYSTEKMIWFRDKAIAGLMEFPENEARNALISLMYYITERNK